MKNQKKKNKRRRKNGFYKLGFYMMLIFTAVVLIGTWKSHPQETHAQNEQRYKYYTSVYVDYGDSLWSIAEQYISAEYKSMHEYIEEVKSINKLENEYLKCGDQICIPYYSSEYKA